MKLPDAPRALRAQGRRDEDEAAVATTVSLEPSSAERPRRSRREQGPPAPRGVPPSLAARYEDIELVGEGGMGAVYRGRDPRLGRLVAIKLLRRGGPDLGRRFLAEARAQARIVHENVCRVYETGVADGEPFIAMQHIDGEPLSRVHDRLTLEQKVKLMVDVAAAVHEAHRLGIIHRDIKPGNILVEEQADGSPKPYVVDFGLAREAGDPGQTRTGAIVGTPAYMSPEQARGDVRRLDRRSDVYSMGATLYVLLSGQAPFTDEHTWRVLLRVASEEPPPLGRVVEGLPRDLETIVMKCLEREPSRRYESARALSEDLRRHLDGEPIRARRASVPYVLWKKARKHRLVAALLAALCAGAVALLGVWARGRREAAEQARLAQELGEGVKEMELFLRAAHELPLHDVERERGLVRRRLDRIQQQMDAAGPAAAGPGHHAMGRGYLALGEPERAREQLERALSAGYASPELEYALGRALGELYRNALSEAGRIADGKERKKRIAEIEASLRDPALAHLRAAGGATLEAPAYAEGLIAYWEGRNEEAVARAREAFEQAPWLYEARKLEGDALSTLGSRHGAAAAFDWEKMMAHLVPAAEAYRAAAEVARSDPAVHRAECVLWTQLVGSAAMKGKNPRAYLDRADAACQRAVTASPRERQARVQRAYAHSLFAGALAGNNVPVAGEDVPREIEAAIALAEQAAQASPDDVQAHDTLAGALATLATYRKNEGLDAREATARGIAACRAVLRLDGRRASTLGDLANMYRRQALLDLWSGADAAVSAREAIALGRRAVELDPGESTSWFAMALVELTVAMQLVERGRSPEPWLARALEDVGGAPGSHAFAADLRTWAHTLAAEWAMDSGADAHEPLERAARDAAEARRLAAGSPLGDEPDGDVALTEARLALEEGGDPRAAIERARAVMRQAVEAVPHAIELRIGLARAEILALRWAVKERRATAAMFEAALAPLAPLLSEERADPHFYLALAEIHALRAAWLVEGGRAPDRDVEQGLAMAGRALSLNPHLGTAFAARGRLHLEQARSARAPAARAAAARAAKEALAAAFRENPMLERQHRDASSRLEALLR